MQVSLMTPQQIVFSGPATDVLVLADKGQINLLERHADIITEVHSGPLRVKGPAGEKIFQVTEGVLRIQGDKCSILCMSAEEKTGSSL